MAEPAASTPGRCQLTTQRQSLPGPSAATWSAPLVQAAEVANCSSVTAGRLSCWVWRRYRCAKEVATDRCTLSWLMPDPGAPTITVVAPNSTTSGSRPAVIASRPEPSCAGLVKSRLEKRNNVEPVAATAQIRLTAILINSGSSCAGLVNRPFQVMNA